MPTGPLTSKDWYDRAEKVRALADTMTNAETRRVLLQIAASYEQLGSLAEADEKTAEQAKVARDRLTDE